MKPKYFDDQFFDSLTNKKFSDYSAIHWSKSSTIKSAVDFFIQNNVQNVLDIGSGIGKFCILGAQFSNIHFTGIEIRKDLHEEAQRIKQKLNIPNLNFIHADIKEINFSDYDAFYYYNPFCEHIAISEQIDQEIIFSEEKYYEYEDFVVQEMEKLKEGTIIILHHAKTFMLSKNYRLIDILENGELTFWVKETHSERK